MKEGDVWSDGVWSRLCSQARTWWDSLSGVSSLLRQWLTTIGKGGITTRNRIGTTTTTETTTTTAEGDQLPAEFPRVRPTALRGDTGCPGPAAEVRFVGRLDCGCGKSLVIGLPWCWLRMHPPGEMPAILCPRCGRDHGIMVEVIARQEIGRWLAESRQLAQLN